ncbi:MAG: DNA topoisomerase I, partial [Nanoarchaeota archaeon]|nr:DNA topoisomerase I [Nanoarchaeota archaeon]
MPKKPKKTREEQSAEEYFPIDEDNLKRTTEKPAEKEKRREDILKRTTEKMVKESTPDYERTVEKSYYKPTSKELQIVEKTGNKKPKRNSRKNAKKTTTKPVKESTSKTLLKKGGYELVITEKPQAAAKIASALGSSRKISEKNVPYYEVDRDGKKIIVACAVGHLFTLKQNHPGSEVPTFDISWVPNFEVRKKDFSKRYYDVIKKLAKNAGELTVATDFDIEGEVIGINVVKYIANEKDANRMKFSTLTNAELNNSYDHKMPHIDWGQAIAGEARHFLDWYYGINLSRALMNAIKTTGKFKIMSIGRVQGPALKLIVDKEKEIKKFKSEPYWQVFIEVKSPKTELKYLKDIFDKKELEKFEDIVGKKGQAQTKKNQQSIEPNPPFNLTTLQTESYRLFGTTPSRTLQIAQSLYLAGLISYPRTSSQKLPASINYKQILEELKKTYKVARLLKRDHPVEGPKSDPAHPSIYPTGNKQILSGEEEKIYDLIVKRFLSLFCEDALVDRKRITVDIEDLKFSANGSQIKRKAWLDIYPSKIEEKDLEDLEGEVTVTKKDIVEKETQPPKRYSQASIISELEKRNLGTKATRASILETLYDRGYVREKSIEATPLGISLIETLEKHSPIIIDERLTKELQDEMDEITETKE